MTPKRGMEMVLDRLRTATPAEQGALAKALQLDWPAAAGKLGIDPLLDSRSAAVLLAEAYIDVAKKDSYWAALRSVAEAVASKAGWGRPEVQDGTQVEWIEDYVYLALGYVHMPAGQAPHPNGEKGKTRTAAELALRGSAPSPKEAADTSTSLIVPGVMFGASFLFGWWAIAGAGLLGLLSWLTSPSMKKVVPATMVLIHIRKRQEFEQVLRDGSVAA